MKAYKCDICGEFYDLSDLNGAIGKAAFNPFTQNVSGMVIRSLMFLTGHDEEVCRGDICPDCVRRLAKTFRDIRKEVGYDGGSENA